MKARWIVVAHRAGARLLAQDPEALTLRVVAEPDNPRARLKNTELDTDGPGASASHGQGGGHPMNSAESAHERTASDFARELGSILCAHRADGHFDELVLVAEPGFLGKLRNALDAPTSGCISHTVRKDLAHVKLQDLVGFLEPFFDVRNTPRKRRFRSRGA